MSTQEAVSEKLDRWLLETLALVAVLAAALLLLWALALVFIQCLGWLKSGEWQPLPFYAVFLSQEAQELALKTYEARIQALAFVPTLGNFEGLEQVSTALSSDMVGLRKVVSWVLDLPLVLWLVAGALSLLAAQGWALEARMK